MSQRPGATDGPGPLSALEHAVLAAMLQGQEPDLAALRAQLARATVASRTYSGVGFVTRLAVPDDIPALPGAASPPLKPLHAAHPELQAAAEFLLQLRGGRLAVLEAYCFEGAWPADASAFRLPA
jgi:hypothetical protein